ncbi:cell division topological specificity factor MinE [Hippea jasoniae]|uniref:cell division topological specificity factor MinE n=1 Tax=Hippea jasoniae TaxID=944479 RepID=UPI0005538968|nr:cell division topological specificity factor MinE [Hippea jasoniae]
MWLDIFKKRKKSSAQQAKERLQIILAHERVSNKAPFLEDLRKDLIAVVAKYVDIDPKQIEVSLQRNDSVEVLEINIPIK